MSSFESIKFPGASYLELTTPIATIGNVVLSPALKEGMFDALDIQKHGISLPRTSGSSPQGAGAAYNRAIRYLATGLYLLGGESAGVDDITKFAAERMRSDGLVARGIDGKYEAVGMVGLHWAAKYGSGIDSDRVDQTAERLLVTARLVHAFAEVNHEVGLRSVDVPPLLRGEVGSKLSVDAHSQGELVAVNTFAEGSIDIFASDLPVIWGYDVRDLAPSVTSDIPFTIQRKTPDTSLPLPLTPSHFSLPLPEAMRTHSEVAISA